MYFTKCLNLNRFYQNRPMKAFLNKIKLTQRKSASSKLSARDFSSCHRDIMTDDYVDFTSDQSAVSEVTKLYGKHKNLSS